MTLCPTHEHLSRRSLLKGTLATAAGGTVLNLGSLFNSRAVAEEAVRQGKRCILLWLNGGASQFETFDMKVGQETGGPFRPIQTKLPGVEVCELMPRIAGMMDDLCVIRSMRTSKIDHGGGIHLMHTGYAETTGIRYPEFGAVIGKYLGHPELDLPTFVKISSNGDTGAGFLGPRFAPFRLDQNGRLPNFSQSNLEPARESRRHGLRSFLEDTYAAEHPGETSKMHRESYDAARRLQNVLDVFDAEEEWPKYKDLYGDSLVGKRCLIARRLVESGVPFVEVGQSGYDTHADNFSGHKGRVPTMDVAWSGLLTDLKQRGLFDDTLVIWMGEIGRTPRINNRSGRDHYVRSWSTALAGAGVKRGYVHGKTDEKGYDVVDGKVTEGDFFGTVYKALGIDTEIQHYVGIRPIPITPFGGEVKDELLA